MKIYVTYKNVELVVVGSYTPAYYDRNGINPPENESFELYDVLHKGSSIAEMLNDDQLEEIAEEALETYKTI